MSRSTKKPYYKDKNKFCQKQASKKVRRVNLLKEVPQGGGFKKMYEQWNITDWVFHAPKDKKAYRK
jgi:hypothetical protein